MSFDLSLLELRRVQRPLMFTIDWDSMSPNERKQRANGTSPRPVTVEGAQVIYHLKYPDSKSFPDWVIFEIVPPHVKTGKNFYDLEKYGVTEESRVAQTREFMPIITYGIDVEGVVEIGEHLIKASQDDSVISAVDFTYIGLVRSVPLQQLLEERGFKSVRDKTDSIDPSKDYLLSMNGS